MPVQTSRRKGTPTTIAALVADLDAARQTIADMQAAAGKSTVFNANGASNTISDAAIAAKNAVILASHGSACTLTIPPSKFAVNQFLDVIQTGAGALAIAGGVGVVMNGGGANVSVGTQWKRVRILCTAENTFIIT